MSVFEFKLGGMHDRLQHFHSLTTTSISLAMAVSSSFFFTLALAAFVLLYIRSLRKSALRHFKIPLVFFAYDDDHEYDRNETRKIVADFTLNSLDTRNHRYDISLYLQLYLGSSEKYMDGGECARKMRVGLLLENVSEKYVTIRTQMLEPSTRELSVSLSTVDLGEKMEPLNGLVTLALDGRIKKACAINAVTAFLLFEHRRQGFVSVLFTSLLHWLWP